VDGFDLEAGRILFRSLFFLQRQSHGGESYVACEGPDADHPDEATRDVVVVVVT